MSSEVGNQFFSLLVSNQWTLFLPKIACGSYDTQLGVGNITSPFKTRVITYFFKYPSCLLIKIFDELKYFIESSLLWLFSEIIAER